MTTTPPDHAAPGTDPRAAYRDALLRLAEHDERVLCLDSDTGGLENTFGARFPDRYLNVGIAEANMLSVASGLAARGYRPYVHTMATFATTRAAEQLKLDVVGNALPVGVVATHSGLSATHLGTTHYALEDLAVVRALAEMTVVVPASGAEVGPALHAAHRRPGPTYLRLGRSATPDIRPEDAGFELGSAATLRSGTDATVIAMGPYPVLMALEAAHALAWEGVSCRVLQVHTLVPLDTAAVLAAARTTAGIVTVEEHRPQGGLGDAVAATVSAEHPLPHRRVAVTGEVGVVVQEHREALEAADVSAAAIRTAVAHVIETGRGNRHDWPTLG
ncbi:transketolase subunit B [Haloactinospora alba]|uniref:Transketolase subunit B n=1 Tax=Haloactinospora alba TaxID=405555 RepID=A0A543N963_9ACTN|nr:transketolase C-terminal domain-containing protein [Haloactinospora alba]TQN28374.1 transketolase subunit B [Haloactinospora alba]